MSTEADIAKALYDYLAAGNVITSSAIARPLLPFNPPSSGEYLDVRPMLRAEPESPALHAGATIRRHIWQVDAVVKDNKGETPGVALAELVAARFAKGTEIDNATGFKISVPRVPTIAAAIQDAPWVRFPVSIPIQVIT